MVIESISVPPALAEKGLTGDVAAQRIVDEVRVILFGEGNSVNIVGRESQGKLKIPAPSGPAPLHSVSDVIRGAMCHLNDYVPVFPSDPCRWEIRIVGEITLIAARIELHLHTLTRQPIEPASVAGEESLSELFKRAAQNLAREHYPRELQKHLTRDNAR